MALIKCPECQKEISDRAGSCPNCGCPITSGTGEKKQETNIQTEIYKTAFIHSMFIAIAANVIPRLLNILRGSYFLGIELGGAFDPAGNAVNLMTNMVMISLIVVIIIEILWMTRKKKYIADLNFVCKYKTIFLTWGSYTYIYCLGLIVMICSFLIRGNLFWWQYYTPVLIQIILDILAVLVGIVFFIKEMSFKKYAIVSVVWGIYAVLNLGFSIEAIQLCNMLDYSHHAAMLVLPVSISMGILWSVSRRKSKFIQ